MTRIMSQEQFAASGRGRFRDAQSGPPKSAKFYKLPADAGRKLLAAELATGLFEGESVVVWVKARGIWESCENLCLCGLVRTALGETREIDDAPIHLFGPPDSEQATAVLAMCLYFFWDVAVAGDRGGLGLFFSHDEWFAAFGGDAERVGLANSVFDARGFEPE